MISHDNGQFLEGLPEFVTDGEEIVFDSRGDQDRWGPSNETADIQDYVYWVSNNSNGPN